MNPRLLSSPEAVSQACACGGGELHHRLDSVMELNNRLQQETRQLRVALARSQSELQGIRAGERQARHSAQHDGLTQLPNRGFFENRLHHALAERASDQVLALLFLDLDDFKQVNDIHGHAAGDILLRVVAARLNQAVRKEDVVCRLGGDEFACLLPGLGQEKQLTQLASKLVESVAAPCHLQSYKLTVRPSIGIAVCPQHGTTGAELLAHADAAMYRAKREHTGYAFFEATTCV